MNSARVHAEAFITMVNACIHNQDYWEIEKILSDWFMIAFQRAIIEDDLNDQIVALIVAQIYRNYNQEVPKGVFDSRISYINSQLIF